MGFVIIVPRTIRSRLKTLSLAGMLLSGMIAPAKAGSLYLDGIGFGGGAVSMNIESFQEQKFRTTIAQQHDFSCGSAALATLLKYNYGIEASEQQVFADMIEHGDKEVISESGFSLLDMKHYLARHGLDSNGYKAPLEKLVEVGLPAIVLMDVRGYRHFVVLEGVQDGWVLLSDPANGMRTEQLGVFEKEWSGIFFLITSDLDRAKGFNSPQKWATAPRSPLALTRYALDLATLAQPGLINLLGF